MYIFILSYSLRSFMVVEITRVLKRPNRTRNYVRHMVVVATWWSGTLRQIRIINLGIRVWRFRCKQVKHVTF